MTHQNMILILWLRILWGNQMKIEKKKAIKPEDLYQPGKMFQDEDENVFLVCRSSKDKQFVVVNLAKNVVIDPFSQQQFLVNWRETVQAVDKPFYGKLIELDQEE